jgi:hypothetical protein
MYILLRSFFPNFIKNSEEINNSSNLENSKILEDDFIDIGSLLHNSEIMDDFSKNKNEDVVNNSVNCEHNSCEHNLEASLANCGEHNSSEASLQDASVVSQIICEEPMQIRDNAQVTILLARYSRMQLIDICRQYGLPRTGGKVQLAERIAIYKNKE